MAYQDQYGSWYSGEDSNFNPNSQLFGDGFVKFSCSLCRGELGYSHTAQNCPSLSLQTWNSPGNNQWGSRDDSFQEIQQENYPDYQPFDNRIPNLQQLGVSHRNNDLPSVDGKLGQQEEETQTYESRIVATISSMLDTFHTYIKKNDQVLEQQAERIAALERAKSSSDEIIKAQAKKIESLEETVEKIESRLKSQQQEQTKQHEANLRRIKQLNEEVPHLRERMVRVDSKLYRVEQKQTNQIHLDYSDDSSDEEKDIDVVQIQDAQGSNKTRSSKPKSQIVQLRGIEANENSSTATNPSEMHRQANNDSCDCCGLNCAHQFRACVNMIQAEPSMKKIKETEIKSLKSKQKRKLQRKWVPRGVFDIKELFKVDTILSEIQCAKQYLPWWKKRRRQITPVIHDSGD